MNSFDSRMLLGFIPSMALMLASLGYGYIRAAEGATEYGLTIAFGGALFAFLWMFLIAIFTKR